MHRTWVALVALMAFASVGVEEAQALPAAVEIVNATLEVPLTGSRWFASTQNASLTVPASVPGEIHTDLFNAHKIGEPYYRFNDVSLRWVAYENWTYTLIFSVPSAALDGFERVWLVADGIDTVANISVNGERPFMADNMYRRYVWDVTQHITSSTNTLLVVFRSAISAANASAAQGYHGEPSLGTPPNCPPPVQNGFCHVNFLRKSPCSFSWDWGPAFATQGIWRDIGLVFAHNVPVLMDVGVTPSLTKGAGPNGTVADNQQDVWSVVALLRFQMPAPAFSFINVTLTLNTPTPVVHSVVTTANSTGFAEVTIPNISGVDVWWPNGYGRQPLYTLNATVHAWSVPGVNLTSQSKQVSMGFRTIELVQDPLPGGKSFEFHVNDVPVFIKGANWVPADAFESRVSSAKLTRLLKSLQDANMNAVRNWGGGIYQRDEFYDICDRLGLLVWEEFMFACSTYPTDKLFLQSVAQEIQDNVLRLMSHPSVFLWSTNNENEAAIAEDWYGTKTETAAYSALYADLYFGTVLPSPSDGNETMQQPISPNPQSQFFGDVHYYNYAADCWDVTTYPRPRFASEFGVQSYPSFLTLKPVSNGSLGDWASIDSAFMQHRQHHPDGNQQMLDQMKLHFMVPNNTDSLTRFQNTILMTQAVQAVCMKTEAEHYRRLRGHGNATSAGYTMGTLYWQANDIWQGASWASQDYTGRWKMLHYYAKQFYAPLAVSGYIEDGNVSLYLVNDGLTDVVGQLQIDLVSWIDGPAAAWGVVSTAPAAASQMVFSEPLEKTLSRGKCASASSCVLQFAFSDVSGNTLSRNYLFLGDFTDMSVLAPPQLLVTSVVDAGTNTFNVSVSAENVAPLVWLETKYEGVWSDNGMLVTSSQIVVTFTAWADTLTAKMLQQDVTVTSLYDMYDFPSSGSGSFEEM